MAFAEDIKNVADSIDRISKNGVPIKLEHAIDNTTMWQFIAGLAAVAVLFVVLLGVKDTVVNRRRT